MTSISSDLLLVSVLRGGLPKEHELRNVICRREGKNSWNQLQATYRFDFVILLLMPDSGLIEKPQLAQDLQNAFVSHSKGVSCKKVSGKIRDNVLNAEGFFFNLWHKLVREHI